MITSAVARPTCQSLRQEGNAFVKFALGPVNPQVRLQSAITFEEWFCNYG